MVQVFTHPPDHSRAGGRWELSAVICVSAASQRCCHPDSVGGPHLLVTFTCSVSCPSFWLVFPKLHPEKVISVSSSRPGISQAWQSCVDVLGAFEYMHKILSHFNSHPPGYLLDSFKLFFISCLVIPVSYSHLFIRKREKTTFIGAFTISVLVFFHFVFVSNYFM